MKYILLIFLSCLSFSEETIFLDIPKSINMALKNTEEYFLQKNDYKKSSLTHKETKSILFPQISGEAFWINNYHSPGIDQKNYIFDFGINVNQIITTFGKVLNKIEMMKNLKRASRYQKKEVKNDIIFKIKLLYFQTYHSKEILKILKKSYENTKKNQEILNKRSKSGRISKYDAIKIKSDIASRIPMLSDARAKYETNLEALKKHLGIDKKTKVKLKQGFSFQKEKLSYKNYKNDLEKNQPILLSLKKVLKANEADIKSKRAEYFPNISFFYKNNYKGISEKYFIGNNVLDRYGSYGINLQMPLFQGNKRFNALKKAHLEKRNTLLKIKKAKKDIHLALKQAILNYNELLKSYTANKESSKLSGESFLLSQKMFSTGKISSSDLNFSELMTTNQKLKEKATLLQLEIEKAKIQRLTGEQ